MFFYRRILRPIVHGVARVVALWHPGVRRAIVMRSDAEWSIVRSSGTRHIHLHVASAGELESGLAVRDAVDRLAGNISWTLTFSSPSGLDYLGDRSSGFLSIGMLPLDKPRSVGNFLDATRPDLLLFIRYDLWPELLRQAGDRGIPRMLVAATIGRRSRLLRRPIRAATRWMYRQVETTSTVNEVQADRLEPLCRSRPQVDGDPRIDRVIGRVASVSKRGRPEHVDVASIRSMLTGRPVLIFGSAWSSDIDGLDIETELADWDIIVVPHDVRDASVDLIREHFPSAQLVSSKRQAGSDRSEPLRLIVDVMGILVELYGLADVAVVGGGFGAGVHSVIEPLVRGIPVVCGTNFGSSPDAVELVAIGGLTVVENPKHLLSVVKRIVGHRDPTAMRSARTFLQRHEGASDRIARRLLDVIRARPADNPKSND